MEFRVLTEHTHKNCMDIANDLKRRGFRITDLRQADILEDGTNRKVGDCYSLTAKGNIFKYLKLKRETGLNEHMWEGYKTLG